MWRDEISLRWNYHLLAKPGYIVLLTNYTGSTGFGEKFGQEIQGDPLKGPGDEINEAADEAIKRYPFIDGTRQAAGGASYGGHLANWLEATTTRYKCLISHAGLVNLESQYARHALRYGVALALGVAVYRIAGMKDHGYWIPLTILFVLRPERDETDRRLVLRAVGTLAGLALATGLAYAFDGAEVPIAIVLSITAALSFGLITVQYALFTLTITTYVVLLSDTLGEGRFEAAGQRLVGTVVGIVIAYLAFRVYPEVGEKRRLG